MQTYGHLGIDDRDREILSWIEGDVPLRSTMAVPLSVMVAAFVIRRVRPALLADRPLVDSRLLD